MPRNGSGTASVVNTFTPLTTADANDVNENFTDIASMITDSLPRDGQAGMSGQLKATSGTVTEPGIAFNADLNTGFRRPAGDSIAAVCGGSDVATFDSTGVSVSTAPTTGDNLTNKTYVDAIAPAGSVTMFASSTVPSGWLECNGAAVSRTTYATLFAAIGTTWGSGDGSTTFTLPDLRGEFVRGWDHGKGTDTGRAFASSQTDALQNITGSFDIRKSGVGPIIETIPTYDGALHDAGTSASLVTVEASGTSATGRKVGFDASRVARTSTETRPRNVALMYIIKT